MWPPKANFATEPKYVFTFASRDEGWHYDVGVASTLPVAIGFPADTRISLWRVDAQGNQVSYKEHGPFPAWTPLNCADNHILWRHVDGHIVLWVMDEQGNQVSYKEHGPFPGWTALNYADGRILWRHVDGHIGPAGAFKQKGTVSRFLPFHPLY
jgi:hypothetical protein